MVLLCIPTHLSLCPTDLKLLPLYRAILVATNSLKLLPTAGHALPLSILSTQCLVSMCMFRHLLRGTEGRGIGIRVEACQITPIPQRPVTGTRKSSGTEIESGPTTITMVIAIVIAVAAVTIVMVDQVASDLDTTPHNLIILATPPPPPTDIIPTPTTDLPLFEQWWKVMC